MNNTSRTSPSLRTVRTKSDALRVFLRQPSPQILAAAFATAISLRARERRFGGRDIALVGTVIAAQGTHEWLIHRFLLHAPRRSLRGLVIDPGAGHREHHSDPDVLDNALLKAPDAASFVALIGAYIALVVSPGRRVFAGRHVLSAVATAYATLLVYEWTHYLDHTSVPLRSTRAQRLRAHHRRHHFVDERRWLGITSTSGDSFFRTAAQQE